MPNRYAPMLKTKKGEIVALGNLTVAIKDRILPVFHVTTSVSPNFSAGLGAVWLNRALAVDGLFSFNTSGSTAPFSALIRALRLHHVLAYPSISISSDPRLITAALSLVDAQGLMVKVQLASLPNLAGWLQARDLASGNVDLVIDVGHIAALPINLLAQLCINSIQASIGPISPYRSVTLAAAAAPKDHGDLPRGRSNVPRNDWALWVAVAPHVPFQIDYGDYCAGHPDLTEPPGVAMASATVSARYTGARDWLIIKGRATSGANGLPMPQQYRSHAAHYVADVQFGGLPGCWADDRIAQINAAAVKPGNRQSWSEIAINRHISMVCSQLP